MKPTEFIPTLVIDATNATLGRLASYTAKQALLGKSVAVVNCEHAIVTGNPRSIIGEYKIMRQRGGSSLNGPFFPKSPERMLKRTIRGMLSYRQGRGEAAFARIRTYLGIPAEFAEMPKVKTGKEKSVRHITLHNLGMEM